ncbi:MAG: hypothetical protein HF981_21475 [Desulfobacteraceae bacterium]|nr:hypothetical protein [Desulfobacteraceae bacterium]MBC2752980.1 hypothetical protein [Desulfobacteraceae bacterium]
MEIIPPPIVPNADPSVRFGQVTLTEEAALFRHAMNREMMAFFRSLPPSTHTDAVVFCMQHFRTPFFPAFDYFRNYPSPAWSVIHWIERHDGGRLRQAPEEGGLARTAHAMALFLHPLDDHLNDGQLPATHLHLLLRSQAWLRMHAALERLAIHVPEGAALVRGFIDAYYASIGSPPAIPTLDGYSTHFRNQMATGLIVPVLMAKTAAGDAFAAAIETAYGAFGIAWRLLDDLQDMAADMASGSHSAIYFCLPAALQEQWDRPSRRDDRACYDVILTAVKNGGIVETIAVKIRTELMQAASAMEAVQMTGLAEELRCLARPFTEAPYRI